ncbi:anther-specific protein LAT52-like [Cynara cardunculus var. scolymus]|uniref:Allergen Ole e 1, conserved site-containing protein n=1 Tax=Cynara cardunculus var. scolymus TaxID=59895 RepID=A0A124SID8_CYNCS|nr:anther-specific protein LAT52-like [Cynara cardunculus var. scolymus]KVI12392.1 Allergen Ole e 1, conserved site-containing protein [Cynara cardunculus var. scolymus]
MADYATLLVLLSMVATARCSWISGGAPPPASIGDYDTLGDELLDPLAPASKLMAQEKDEVAPGPEGNFMIEGKDEEDEDAPGPSSDFMVEVKDEAVPGPSDDTTDEEKGSIAEGPAAADKERVMRLQLKESAPADGQGFIVQGKVYCDPCRIQFPTKISYPLPNTKVSLLCHKEETDEETYRLEGTSDDKGKYTLKAVGDHADEVCEISVSESPDPKCPELMDDENHVRVSLTNKQGAKGNARLANPLGFMVTDADPRCKEVLDELGFTGI